MTGTTATARETSVTIRVNEILTEERLEPSIPLGPTWEIVTISDMRVLRLTDEIVIGPAAIDVPQTHIWKFTGRNQGQATITLISSPEMITDRIHVTVIQ